MNEAEDSKCQTMKDSSIRMTFCNYQSMKTNTSADAPACRRTDALKKTN